MRLHLTRRFKKVTILFIAAGAVLAAGVAIYQSGLPELGVDWALEKVTHAKISANSHQISLKWTGLELDAQGVALWLPPDRTSSFSARHLSLRVRWGNPFKGQDIIQPTALMMNGWQLAFGSSRKKQNFIYNHPIISDTMAPLLGSFGHVELLDGKIIIGWHGGGIIIENVYLTLLPHLEQTATASFPEQKSVDLSCQISANLSTTDRLFTKLKAGGTMQPPTPGRESPFLTGELTLDQGWIESTHIIGQDISGKFPFLLAPSGATCLKGEMKADRLELTWPLDGQDVTEKIDHPAISMTPVITFNPFTIRTGDVKIDLPELAFGQVRAIFKELKNIDMQWDLTFPKMEQILAKTPYQAVLDQNQVQFSGQTVISGHLWARHSHKGWSLPAAFTIIPQGLKLEHTFPGGSVRGWIEDTIKLQGIFPTGWTISGRPRLVGLSLDSQLVGFNNGQLSMSLSGRFPELYFYDIKAMIPTLTAKTDPFSYLSNLSFTGQAKIDLAQMHVEALTDNLMIDEVGPFSTRAVLGAHPSFSLVGKDLNVAQLKQVVHQKWPNAPADLRLKGAADLTVTWPKTRADSTELGLSFALRELGLSLSGSAYAAKGLTPSIGCNIYRSRH
ncbi:MAG: hypothetical protein HQK56_19805 [Deltaproteobacteria bacterium]|nr:hypothetical protein [Deltaproteobacteria bacterium]